MCACAGRCVVCAHVYEDVSMRVCMCACTCFCVCGGECVYVCECEGVQMCEYVRACIYASLLVGVCAHV